MGSFLAHASQFYSRKLEVKLVEAFFLRNANIKLHGKQAS